MRRIAHRRVGLALFGAVVGILILLAAVAGSERGSGRSAVHGVMTPALGAHPKFQLVGQKTGGSGLQLFGCQKTVPAGCYGPDQMRAAYGVQPLLNGGLNGSGKTIVIVDAYGSSTLAQDLAIFDSAWGIAAPPHFTVLSPFGIDPTNLNNLIGWSGETTLDTEWSHAIAPSANIVVVLAKSNDDQDILNATQYAYDNNLGDVLSQSFGEAEQCMNPSLLAQQHALFDAMTGKGWTLFASSGDDGSSQPTCDGSDFFQAASTPASDPDVTGVGGTSLVADGNTGAYQSESIWNDSFGAGGGGFSVVYGRPDFQAPIVKDSKMRAVPDVAYNAAVVPGVLSAWQEEGLQPPGTFFRFGGTSAGSPQWAALIAIADQMSGGRVGNINKTLYHLGAKAQGAYFHDATVGNNDVTDAEDNPIPGFAAGPGFDEASGWGSPIASALLPAIAKPGNG